VALTHAPERRCFMVQYVSPMTRQGLPLDAAAGSRKGAIALNETSPIHPIGSIVRQHRLLASVANGVLLGVMECPTSPIRGQGWAGLPRRHSSQPYGPVSPGGSSRLEGNQLTPTTNIVRFRGARLTAITSHQRGRADRSTAGRNRQIDGSERPCC
jgi:hypothetical protein